MPSAIPRGIPLEQALRRWNDPDAVRRMDEYERYRGPLIGFVLGRSPSRYELMHRQWNERRKPLENILVGKLRKGELIGTGLQMPPKPDSRRQYIEEELWELLELDFENSEAKYPGLHLKLVEVLNRSKWENALSSSRQSSEFSGSASQENRRIQGAAETLNLRGREVHLSDDNRILTIFEKRMVIGGRIQQSIIRQLVDAQPTGEWLRSQTVLHKAGSQADSIAKAFAGSPHWPMIRKVLRQQGGQCWLDVGHDEHGSDSCEIPR
jgi:hypothetical protein